MPFASDKQRRFMYAKHSSIAKRRTAEEQAAKAHAAKPKRKKLTTSK